MPIRPPLPSVSAARSGRFPPAESVLSGCTIPARSGFLPRTMSKRSSAPARVIAVTALVCGVVVLLVVITTSLGGDDRNSGKPAANGKTKRSERRGEDGKIRGAYVVQNGDTLSSIA